MAILKECSSKSTANLSTISDDKAPAVMADAEISRKKRGNLWENSGKRQMASVGQRHRKTQAAPAPETHIDVVRVETNAERFQWLEEISRLTSRLTPGGVAYALRLFVAWNRKDAFCFPSQETVAKDLGVSRSSAGRYQKLLEEHGFLIVQKRRLRRQKHPHNIYIFALPNTAQIRSKPLNANENNTPTEGANHVSPVTHGLEPDDASKELPAEKSAESEVMSHQCDVTMRHQCSTNHVIEPIKGGPTAPPLESSISGLSDVAREVALARSQVDPDQLSFFDRLGPHQQRHFLTLSADDRECFQLAYEVDDDD
ncbi:helix-turn-helix domain-containing protein [Rhizobium ruizarguesonis]